MTNTSGVGNAIEIDVTEAKYPNKSNMALHNWSAVPKWAEGLQRTENGVDLSGGFHTYGLLWTEDKLTWYLDGDQVYELKNDIANVPVDLKFSSAVVDWASAGPVTDALIGQTMEIDYVRVYKYEGSVAETVIDNGQPGYTESGIWNNSSLPGYNGSGSRYSTNTSAPAYADWRPALSEGMYRVAIYRIVNPSNPASGDSSAQITIGSNDGTKTVPVNYTIGVTGWYDLGTYSFGDGTAGYVRNTISGGIARADAVRFIKLNPVIVVDNSSSGFSVTGSWASSTSYSPSWSSKGFYGSDYLTDNTSGVDTGTTAIWTPPITQAGFYNIYLRWTADSDRPAAAPLEIRHKRGTDISKTADQTQNNDTWVEIGTYEFDPASTNSIALKATQPGFTIADAAKFVRITAPTVYAEAETLAMSDSSGDTRSNHTDTYASNGKYDLFSAFSVNDYITYTVPVSSPGTYRVKIVQREYSNRGIYQLSINGAPQGSPQDAYASPGSFEEIDLGTRTFNASGNYSFEFRVTGKNAASSEYAISIDAIKLVQ